MSTENASASPAILAAKEKGASNAVTPPLELGWTRVRRKRPRLDQDAKMEASASHLSKGDGANDGADDEYCVDCVDPNCRRQGSISFLPASASVDDNGYYKGRVIWLLHDLESEWFQGYFFLPGQSRPWGLLALIQELDECLQCSEGGYRQIRLQVHLPSGGTDAVAKNTSTSNTTSSKKDLGVVEWTGGDMMRLESASVKMEPDKVVTGDKAAAIATDLFKGIWERLRTMYDDQEGEIDGSDSTLVLLDLLPDVAVVHGSMELRLPPMNVE